MTSLHIIAERDGKRYSLTAEIEANWQPLDARGKPLVDMVPWRFVELVLGNEHGWSRYKFPTED